MLNVKAADDPEAALKALWPRLQSLAVEPARDEADYVERSAFQLVAFEAQYLVRGLGLKPNTVVPGWDEHFVALVRENSKAANARAAAATVEGQLERRRQELLAQGRDLAVPPREPLSQPALGSPVAVVRETKGDKRSSLGAAAWVQRSGCFGLEHTPWPYLSLCRSRNARKIELAYRASIVLGMLLFIPNPSSVLQGPLRASGAEAANVASCGRHK